MEPVGSQGPQQLTALIDLGKLLKSPDGSMEHLGTGRE